MQRASRWPRGPVEHCTDLLSDPQTRPKLQHKCGRKLIQKTEEYVYDLTPQWYSREVETTERPKSMKE